jgi:GNAT superfamily N-acetyltransferase
VKLSPVEPLNRTHLTDDFDCGSTAQSQWLRRHALQAQSSGGSRVYVVSDLGTERVVGYYALAAGDISPASAPGRLLTGRLLKGQGAYDQPVIVLTRLGVDQSAQGMGLGAQLVMDAFDRVNETADLVGVRALLIHCESEAARAFYRKLARFEESPSDPLHLLLLIKDLRRAIRRAEW